MMKRSVFFLAGLLVSFLFAQPATAAWTYDSSAGTISDGNWTLRVNRLSDGTYSLGGGSGADARAYIAGEGDLDLRGVEADTGITLSQVFTSAFWKNAVMTSLILPDTVVTIGYAAASGCTALTNVVLSANLQTLGSSAFSYCTVLETVTPFLPDTLTSLGDRAFQSSNALGGDLKLLNPAIDEVAIYTFFWCTGITSAVMPYVNAIEQGVFEGCTSITNVVMNEAVQSIGKRLFYGCTELESFYPTKMDSLTSLGDRAFYNCQKMKGDFTFRNPALQTIDAMTFFSCASITSVEIPYAVTLGTSAFRDCTSLKRVEFGYQLQSIGERSFNGCTSLETVTPFLPPSVTSISSYAFSGCTAITNELSLTNPALVNFPNQSFYRFKGPKITLPPSASTFARTSFTQLTPGVEIYFLGDAPASITSQAFSTTDSNDPCVMYACRVMDKEGWAAVTTELTDADRAKASFPGSGTFGLLVDGSARNWLVHWKSPLASGPFVLQIQ